MRLPHILLIAALAAGFWARLSFAPAGAEHHDNRSPDEAMYTVYASVLVHEGLVEGTRVSVREYNANPRIQIFPVPTRVGFLAPLAAYMKSKGSTDLDVGIAFSRLLSVLSLLLLAALAWRHFDPWTAFFAVALFAFCPMELALSRKVWQDGLMTLAGGALLFLALEAGSKRFRAMWVALFCAAGFFTLLVKESAAAALGVLGILLLVSFVREKDRKGSAVLVAGGIAAGAAAWACLAWLAGGMIPLLSLYRNFRASLPANEYVRTYQTGPIWSFPEGLFRMSPVTTLLAFAGVALAFVRRKDPKIVLTAAGFVLFLAVATIPAYFKNLRFLSPVYFAFVLAAGEALGALARRPKAWGMALALLLLSLAAASDAVLFQKRFIEGHTKDLVNRLLTEKEAT